MVSSKKCYSNESFIASGPSLRQPHIGRINHNHRVSIDSQLTVRALSTLYFFSKLTVAVKRTFMLVDSLCVYGLVVVCR